MADLDRMEDDIDTLETRVDRLERLVCKALHPSPHPLAGLLGEIKDALVNGDHEAAYAIIDAALAAQGEK